MTVTPCLPKEHKLGENLGKENEKTMILPFLPFVAASAQTKQLQSDLLPDQKAMPNRVKI